MTVAKYRKKPVVIEAIQWDGSNYDECREFVGGYLPYTVDVTQPVEGEVKPHTLEVETMEGTTLMAKPTWWIIRGVKGELYPCDAEVFEQSYEAVED